MATKHKPQPQAGTLAKNVANLSLGRLLDFWEALGEVGRERLSEARGLWERDHARNGSVDEGDDGPDLYSRGDAA